MYDTKAKLWASGVSGKPHAMRQHSVSTPKMFAPPYSGSSYFGQAYRWELVLHYKFWVFIAIKAWIREIAGGAQPLLGSISQKTLAKGRSHKAVHKAFGHGPQEHEEFEPYPFDHPLRALLRNPNKPDVAYDLWAYHTLFKCLTGSAHWWVIRNQFKIPVEIWVIPTHWIQGIACDRDGQPQAYVVQSPWGVLQYIAYDEVISFYEHSPLNRYEGYAVLQAIGEWLDCYEAQTRTRLAVYKNGAMPSFHVALGDSYGDPDEAILNRYYAKWFARFQGEDKSGLPIITGSDLEIKDMPGARPTEIINSTVASEEQMRDMVLAAFNVPKAIVGLEPTNDTSAYAPQRQFCRFAINPELTYTGQVLTEKLVRPTPGCSDGMLWWKDRVIDDPEQKRAEIESRRNGGSISPNEERTMWGAEPWAHGGDNPVLGGVEVPWCTGKQTPDDTEVITEHAKIVNGDRDGLVKLYQRAYKLLYQKDAPAESLDHVRDAPAETIVRELKLMRESRRANSIVRAQIEHVVDAAHDEVQKLGVPEVQEKSLSHREASTQAPAFWSRVNNEFYGGAVKGPGYRLLNGKLALQWRVPKELKADSASVAEWLTSSFGLQVKDHSTVGQLVNVYAGMQKSWGKHRIAGGHKIELLSSEGMGQYLAMFDLLDHNDQRIGEGFLDRDGKTIEWTKKPPKFSAAQYQDAEESIRIYARSKALGEGSGAEGGYVAHT